MSKFSDYNFKGKRALVRVDFNVPLNEQFEITDDNRMQATIPTIKKIIADGGSAILMSHLGRPKDGPTEKYSLKHLVKHLGELLPGTKIHFAPDCIGEPAASMAGGLKPGEVLLLENLRFYKEEEKGDGLKWWKHRNPGILHLLRTAVMPFARTPIKATSRDMTNATRNAHRLLADV